MWQSLRFTDLQAASTSLRKAAATQSTTTTTTTTTAAAAAATRFTSSFAFFSFVLHLRARAVLRVHLVDIAPRLSVVRADTCSLSLSPPFGVLELFPRSIDRFNLCCVLVTRSIDGLKFTQNPIQSIIQHLLRPFIA